MSRGVRLHDLLVALGRLTKPSEAVCPLVRALATEVGAHWTRVTFRDMERLSKLSKRGVEIAVPRSIALGFVERRPVKPSMPSAGYEYRIHPEFHERRRLEYAPRETRRAR
jgi:hypothetical protein